MRSDEEFISGYQAALKAVDPATDEMGKADVRTLALTEVCLEFLVAHLPGEGVGTVPLLMMGYPKLIAETLRTPKLGSALAMLRHLAGRFGSVSAWLDACVRYQATRETIRCFSLIDRKPIVRRAVPAVLRQLLRDALTGPVPWATRKLNVAAPGEALVTMNRGRTILSYEIPAVAVADSPVRRHSLQKRSVNPPIVISLAELKRIAREVDRRESGRDWPGSSLPPLQLLQRLEKLEIDCPKSDVFHEGTITLDGAVHWVGMLSSGKSTLSLALMLGLSLGGSGHRTAVLVQDTSQGAVLAARLRRHGVAATVLSSVGNRDRHLASLQWRNALSPSGWSISNLGELAEGFSSACGLDGLQDTLRVVRGESTDTGPSFREKPCHRLRQKSPSENDDDAYEVDDVVDGRGRSCPLFPRCPAQEQQRSAVEAQVLIMTPQAFVHMTPDPWTLEDRMTIPELLQYVVDLVIIDEVDGVQKSFDDIFSPRSPIMGDEREVYAPTIGTRSSEALRERSGHQFRRSINARWQSNFFTMFGLVGWIYALLQNERHALAGFYQNTPFTAGSVLYVLWEKHLLGRGVKKKDMTFNNPEHERRFLELIRVASTISRYSSSNSVGMEDEPEQEVYSDEALRDAAAGLQEVARHILVADYYEALVPMVEGMMETSLRAFSTDNSGGRRREDALAILLAVVADLTLAHYSWLVKAQPSVATDLGIGDGEVISHASNLVRHYRTLLPSNPAGAVFGLFYDEPPLSKQGQQGGKLTFMNHLGVGRHLVAHLHDLLVAEGQAGPHVLMLSGTSWAGGTQRRFSPQLDRYVDEASPSFDVQVPVRAVLLQPKAELEAIQQSVFSLVALRDRDGQQVRMSGVSVKQRRLNLAHAAQRLASRRDGSNMFEDHWRQREAVWGAERMESRRRALVVTNSYDDAAVVADALVSTLDANGYVDWRVSSLVRDPADDGRTLAEVSLLRARPLPRSMIERFGSEQEPAVLVAPMQVVARGHNILNNKATAALSAIYFLHRPHPRPDDLAPIIGRLNRFSLERFDQGMKGDLSESTAVRARRMRSAAARIVREGLAMRSGYSGLGSEYQAQFAWDMLTPVWQTIGRGIRGGCPVFVGFVDRQFAPQSFRGEVDNANSSALVQAIRQLEHAFNPELNPGEHAVADRLYRPFYEALCRTENLNHV